MKTLNVAIVGFGFMGRTHYGAWKKTPCAKVAAICDSNLSQLSRKVAGNGNDADLTTDFKGVAVVESFDELLARGGFDVVDLTLPTPLHLALVKKALASGCHVLCEKPMALDVKSCNAMIAAAAKSRGKLMIAQCLRFAPAVKYLHDVVASGKYGKVVGASFDRASMLPGWGAGGKSWFLDEEASGGVLLDLHIHDTDLVNWWFGRPKGVSSQAHRRADGVMLHIATSYLYPDKVVSAVGNWGAVQPFVFEASFRVMFERAVVVCDTRRTPSFVVYPEKGKPFTPKFKSEDPYFNEIKAFWAWTAGKAVCPFAVREARDSVALVDAEKKSAQTGKVVR